MGLSDSLAGKNVFIDTAPLIYFIEGHSSYQSILEKFFIHVDAGKIKLQTSTLTLIEVLVKPFRLNRPDLVTKFEWYLTNTTSLNINDLTTGIAKKAAEIRARYNLKTPDAIQIPTAIEYSCDLILTNDHSFKKINELEVFLISDMEKLE